MSWTSSGVWSGFQSQLSGMRDHLHAMDSLFTSSVTPAGLLATSMVVEPFGPHTYTCVRGLMAIQIVLLFNIIL